MIDFLMIATRTGKRGVIEIYPKFIIKKSKDLMIRGSDFYAIWLEDRGLWSVDEQDALQLIDHELDIYTNEHKEHLDNYRVLHMWDAESGMIDNWHKYCQRQMRDNYHTLDEQLIFANTPVKKESYASKRLPYVLEPGNIDAYDELMQTLYSPEEREKIEWCIGSIVNGDSKTIQKFMVLYGPPGSGKSTVLNIIQKLFTGYYAAFDSQALGSASNAFSLEAFKANPLIAIQHEGNLSKIEDNTRLNSLVSHETMMVNEKFRSAYANQFKSFLILATNKPVKITDAKSGLIRRLIDVVPTGEKVPQKRYSELYAKTDFELGGIAWHCKEVYEGNKHRYDDYIPTRMLGASNDFYNFMLDRYYIFKKEDGISLKRAWAMYDEYNQRAKVVYPYSMRAFREELMNYFADYKERAEDVNGERVRSYYSGFKADKFKEFADPTSAEAVSKEEPSKSWIDLKPQHKKADSDKYMGLFGKNLMTRANYDAKQAEKQANASGSEADLAMAATLRDKANNMKVYQLKLETVKKLKVPSDENASDITAGLLKEKEFKQNLEVSIADSKEKMRRPTQQVLFKQAENALKKDPTTLTASEKVAIYKALNLSLTNHNAQEVAAQSRFYAELSKKGYNALLDYNDKDYSSYHAKRPMIVFDTDSVRLQSVTETNPKVVDKLYMRYNAERIAKEVGANTIGYVSKLGNKTVSECSAYMERKMNDYLS